MLALYASHDGLKAKMQARARISVERPRRAAPLRQSDSAAGRLSPLLASTWWKVLLDSGHIRPAEAGRALRSVTGAAAMKLG